MNSLSPEQKDRAVELLRVVVMPGDHDFCWAIEEAHKLLGIEVKTEPPPPKRGRPRKYK
jgi:hypothetical protein